LAVGGGWRWAAPRRRGAATRGAALAAAPRRRGAMRIRTANSPCHACKEQNSVHLPAADARSVPKTLAVGGAAAPRAAAPPRRRGDAAPARRANSHGEFDVIRRANSPNSPGELWHAVRIYTLAL